MTTEPEQLRREIEQTQRGLSADVNALTEKVTPRRIVQRRVEHARRAITTMRDKVMGTASNGTEAVADTASSVADNVSSAASSAAQTVSELPQTVRRGTEGNPLATGLIAFGLGWLTASLLPPSTREQELAGEAKDFAQEHAQPVIGQAAEQMKDNLREPAQDAVESIKSAADDAGSTVADQTRSAAADLTGQVHGAKDKVTG
jgi:ElaB/YqjD/DUF883 family membrane-anchored ribosome-binding protein